MEENDFYAAWAEGAALSTDEAIAYARRGRGERKRPTRGWASLTPTERGDVPVVWRGVEVGEGTHGHLAEGHSLRREWNPVARRTTRQSCAGAARSDASKR